MGVRGCQGRRGGIIHETGDFQKLKHLGCAEKNSVLTEAIASKQSNKTKLDYKIRVRPTGKKIFSSDQWVRRQGVQEICEFEGRVP